MNQISLTASMRSNLLALQNIARQQDIVQNRLATGLKVSSAIDNPSAYYTAASLSNRAADLTALLDAMSQGVQTIKTASEAIDSGIKFLEQAKAVANQALETAVPAKEWFIEQVGENGAVVETAQELLDAVNTGKETIVVYGKIELENQNIELQDGQKLVGTEYYTGLSARNADGSRFSQLEVIYSELIPGCAVRLSNDTIVADLDISCSLRYLNTNGAIVANNVKNCIIRNVNVDFSFGMDYADHNNSSCITISNSSVCLEGDIKLESDKYGIYVIGNSIMQSYANMDITTPLAAIYTIDASSEIYGQIISHSSNFAALRNGANFYLKSGSSVILDGSNSFFLFSRESSDTATATIEENVKIQSSSNILSYGPGHLNIAKNVFFKIGIQAWKSEVFGNWDFNSSIVWEQLGSFVQTGMFDLPVLISEKILFTDDSRYFDILNQYNMLIADSFYKGINLLQGQNLQINFNEDRSSKVEVKGVKADSESLGLTTKEWNSQEDIEKSISELETAINSLRSFASAFGNYYSIVTTRQDFTENLINVLEEGTDKLTLADMNEESANMLALQTSQQLAINSLSLASQAAQSVLKLF